MASLNKIILIGHLGADPETRYTTGGDAITNARLATSESWKDKATGEKRETTEWHRLVFYRKLAEIARDLLKKGSLVYVEGKIKNKKWTDKDGMERYNTDIEVSEMKLLSRKESDQGGVRHEQTQAGGGSVSDLDDDIPF